MAVTEEKAQHEPTMEEILASIRRIISANGSDEPEADSGPANGFGAERAPAPANEGLPDDDPPSAAPQADEADVLELTDRIELEPDTDEDAEPVAIEESEAAPAHAQPERDSARLLSPATTAASAGSLGELAELLSGAGRERDFGGRSVEQLVAELLRPMLREWLDRNLPGMVETLVRAEIERLADLVKR